MSEAPYRIHAAKLKLEMAKRDMSIDDLADTCGVGRRIVANWVAGTIKPAPREREVLILLFGKYDE